MSRVTEEIIEIEEPEIISTIVPEVVPNIVPNVVPNIVPNVVPNIVPNVVPNIVPSIVPNVVKEIEKTPVPIPVQKSINVCGIFFRNETAISVSLNIVYPDFLKINEKQYQCVIEETGKTIVANIVIDPLKMTLPIPPDAVFKVVLEHDSGRVTSFRTYNVIGQVINNFIMNRDELAKSVAATIKDKPKNNFVMIKYTNGFNNGKPNTFLGFKIKSAYGLVSFYKPMAALVPGDYFLCNAEHDGTMSFSVARKLQIIKVTHNAYDDTIDYVSEYNVAHKMMFVKDQYGNYACVICGNSRWSIVDAR